MTKESKTPYTKIFQVDDARDWARNDIILIEIALEFLTLTFGNFRKSPAIFRCSEGGTRFQTYTKDFRAGKLSKFRHGPHMRTFDRRLD